MLENLLVISTNIRIENKIPDLSNIPYLFLSGVYCSFGGICKYISKKPIAQRTKSAKLFSVAGTLFYIGGAYLFIRYFV